MDTKELFNENYDLDADVLGAIAERYEAIRPTFPTGTDHHNGGFIYDGGRTRTETVVFRFGRNGKGDLTVHKVDGITAEKIKAGEYDIIIRDSFNDCASSNYWYTYLKDYGDPD